MVVHRSYGIILMRCSCSYYPRR